MKNKREKIYIPAMLEAYRRVFGTDEPAVTVLGCEASRKTRQKVERVYEEVMRERELHRADQ